MKRKFAPVMITAAALITIRTNNTGIRIRGD